MGGRERGDKPSSSGNHTPCSSSSPASPRRAKKEPWVNSAHFRMETDSGENPALAQFAFSGARNSGRNPENAPHSQRREALRPFASENCSHGNPRSSGTPCHRHSPQHGQGAGRRGTPLSPPQRGQEGTHQPVSRNPPCAAGGSKGPRLRENRELARFRRGKRQALSRFRGSLGYQPTTSFLTATTSK